ncbi:rod shape-determining protein MreC [Candidatus Dependentiae bacterium]|nr:rod shape-determining protein MreC [Candidatus Dependentiae bacterium]
MAPTRLIWLTIIAGLSFFVLALLKDTTPSQWASTLVGYSCYPFLVLQLHIRQAMDRVTVYNASYEELQRKVHTLQEEQQALTLENHRLAMTCQYHDDIAQLVAFAKTLQPTGGHVCQVLLRHLAADRQYFLVQGGSQHGIAVGMVALLDQYLLGSVTHVMPQYCTVTLITDKKSAVAAYCTTTRAAGILAGENNKDRCSLRFVDHLAPITIGDTIVSSGEGLLFPRGFIVGTVVTDAIDGVYHRIQVQPALSFDIIRYCILIDPATMIPIVAPVAPREAAAPVPA